MNLQESIRRILREEFNEPKRINNDTFQYLIDMEMERMKEICFEQSADNMSKEIREQIDKFKEFLLNESKKKIKDKLLNHLVGGSIIDSVENIDFFLNYFNGDIPDELKYEGSLYRVFQTTSKPLYNKILKNGFNVLPNQKYYACSKSMKGIKSVILKTSKRRYKYYIIYKFDVYKDDVLFDMNKMIDFLGIDENRFTDEEEVLVLSSKVPFLPTDNIIKHGMY
jgi:hypothetical protein